MAKIVKSLKTVMQAVLYVLLLQLRTVRAYCEFAYEQLQKQDETLGENVENR